MYISGNMLRPRGGEAIADSMSANVKLSVLDLSHCGIQDAGAGALGDACRSYQVCTLPDLKFALNSCSDVAASAAGLDA